MAPTSTEARRRGRFPSAPAAERPSRVAITFPTAPGEHRLAPSRDCVLVVANEGERTLEGVAALRMTQEGARQLEQSAADRVSVERGTSHCGTA